MTFTDLRRHPRPHARLCPLCDRIFSDLWTFKDHQDECIAESRRARVRA